MRWAREISQLSKVHPPLSFRSHLSISPVFLRDYCIVVFQLSPSSLRPIRFITHGYTSLSFVRYYTHTLAPSAPTIVNVEATSSTSISVYWESSEKDGGNAVTGYVVEYRPTSNPSFETQVVATDVFFMVLDGLTPSTEYNVRVRVENAVGRSVPSATLQTKTDGELIVRSFSRGLHKKQSSSNCRRSCCVFRNDG